MLGLILATMAAGSNWPTLVERRGFECLVEASARLPTNRRIYVDFATDRGRCNVRQVFNVYPEDRPPADAATPRTLLLLQAGELACLRANRKRIVRIARPVGSNALLVDLRACRRP